MVVDLQGEVKLHEIRIKELETINGSARSRGVVGINTRSDVSDPHLSYFSLPDQLDTNNPLEDEAPTAPYDNTPVSQPKAFSMDTLDLGPPIATLRSLGDLSTNKAVLDTQESPATSHSIYSTIDPISRGVLSVDDAQAAINR